MNNPTTRDFMNAKPDQKAEMVIDGLVRVARDLETVARNLKVLNGWVRCYPGLVQSNLAKMPDADMLHEAFKEFAMSTDKLTEQFVLQSEHMKAFQQFHNSNPDVL